MKNSLNRNNKGKNESNSTRKMRKTRDGKLLLNKKQMDSSEDGNCKRVGNSK